MSTMKKEINYSDIKSFINLVEAGSFTNAAERMMCSRSHVSKQLTQLESSLGVSLLVRTTRTQHLTPQGEAFYQKCKASFDGIDHAVERAMESVSMLAGEIKINCVGGYIGESIVGSLINDFMQIHPDINIMLDFTSKRVDLISGEFDFVFRMGELMDSALIARKLAELKINIFASPAYLKKYGKPQEPKELVNHKCITGSMHSWHFKHIKTNQKIEVNIKGDLECKNGRVMLHSALLGNGIIRVPEIYCLKELREKQLIPVFQEWSIEPTPFYLVYLNDKHQPARIKAFKEFIITHFEQYLKI